MSVMPWHLSPKLRRASASSAHASTFTDSSPLLVLTTSPVAPTQSPRLMRGRGPRSRRCPWPWRRAGLGAAAVAQRGEGELAHVAGAASPGRRRSAVDARCSAPSVEVGVGPRQVGGPVGDLEPVRGPSNSRRRRAHRSLVLLVDEAQAVQREPGLEVGDGAGQRARSSRTDRRWPRPWRLRRARPGCARTCRRPATCSRRSRPTASTRPCCRPITLRGSTSSTRRSAAARANRASRLMSMPGKMAPPRYSPLAEMASKVVAVPKSTTIDRPAEEVEGGHGVGDAVGADLLGVVVEDRQAGADAGLDDEGGDAEVALAHAPQRAGHPGHRRAQRDAVDVVVAGEAVEAEELLDAPGRARRPCARRWWRCASGRAGGCRPGGGRRWPSSGSRS